MSELIPPDRECCQALMAFGPASVDPKAREKRGGSRKNDRYWRCNNKPAFIVTETESDDGRLGSMSVCKDCFIQLCLQRGGSFNVTEDLREKV